MTYVEQEKAEELIRAIQAARPPHNSFIRRIEEAWKRQRRLTPRQYDTARSALSTFLERQQETGLRVVDKPEWADALLLIFDGAARRIQYPRVRFVLTDGTYVVISRASRRSVDPGALHIASDSAWEDRTYYGRVHRNGELSETPRMTDEIRRILRDFATDPAVVAAAEGHLTDCCCFCRSPMTTPESRAVGYGPTCAKTYGLPWGLKKNPDRADT